MLRGVLCAHILEKNTGATLHGAIFDNAGGNNTIVNNVMIGEEKIGLALLDFGSAGTSKSQPYVGRNTTGSIVKSNIFIAKNNFTRIMDVQGGLTTDNMKPNGSDFNVFWSYRRGCESREDTDFPRRDKLDDVAGVRHGAGRGAGYV